MLDLAVSKKNEAFMVDFHGQMSRFDPDVIKMIGRIFLFLAKIKYGENFYKWRLSLPFIKNKSREQLEDMLELGHEFYRKIIS